MSIYLHIWRTIGNGANLVASRTFFLRWAHCTHTRTQFYKHLPIHIYTYIYIYSAPLALSQLGNRALMSPRSTAQLIAYEHSGWHISTIIWTYQRNHMNISAQSYEHMNESYDTSPWTISSGFQWVMSDIFVFMRHVTYEQVISHVSMNHLARISMSHVRHIRFHELCDIWTSHITRTHTHIHVYTHTHTHTHTHIWTRHITCIHEPSRTDFNESCHTYSWAMWHMNTWFHTYLYSTQKIYRETRYILHSKDLSGNPIDLKIQIFEVWSPPCLL